MTDHASEISKVTAPVDGMSRRSVRPLATLSAARDGWRFVILVEIENFTVLRRQHGRARTDALAGEITATLRELVDGATAISIGRGTIEMTFESEQRIALTTAITAIETAFERPVDVDGEDQQIDLLVGAAATSSLRRDDVRLIEAAERALAMAQVDRVAVVHDVTGSPETVDRIALARDLSHAILRDELILHYQPKVHVRRQEIASVEALVRWRHPVRGMIQPNDFIPIAEESRGIVALTLWTIRKVITDQRTLAEHGHDLTVFINIAGVLLGDTRFVRQACTLIQTSGAKIGFEITETSVIRDPESAIANLKVFAGIGITIAIDDYGAGLSSLAYLKQLPAKELKIDKLFVTQLTSSNRDPLIVRSTIDLAHALDMEVVAEGVETPSALALLSVMGCDMVQGYLISRPIAIEALIDFLDNDRHVATAENSRAALGRMATVWKRG
ncbi:EAL domain-containing protein [Sphingomonas bacterium]|uniref:EAL domain-containing protein n=1 Tax=Sphingomonas bacterium TaxID=1895847 RepID=UPI0020C6F8CD|nr:EAL domain-containing protein [Sphingomonas bacterium]